MSRPSGQPTLVVGARQRRHAVAPAPPTPDPHAAYRLTTIPSRLRSRSDRVTIPNLRQTVAAIENVASKIK
jgi:hypothetical protein